MKKLLGIVALCLLWDIPVSADERFIPLELFTGGKIRNDTEIKYTPADKIFGEKRRKKIIGPQDWKNPFTKEIIKVYKRTQKNREGNGCKFPLGFWKKGETRSFSVTDSGRSRTVELKILKLGKKPTDCIKYNWKLFDTSGNKLADNDYKFCKNRAMTSLKIRKIK